MAALVTSSQTKHVPTIQLGSSTMGGLLLGVLLTALMGPAVASLDPSLCPFELGYNPVFNADGSMLFCQKGAEQFAVDPPNGTVARALRGVGASVLGVQIAAAQQDAAYFAYFLDPAVTFFLQDGLPRGLGDPLVRVFLFNERVFGLTPGVDLRATFDITNYQFLSGNPTSAFAHVKLITRSSVVDWDTIWRFNTVRGGRKVWQLFQAFNLVVTSK